MSINPKSPHQAIVISATSDIGESLCLRWVAQGTRVFGTYRRESPAVARLRGAGVTVTSCDLSDKHSMNRACAELKTQAPSWDTLILCPGDLAPVGPFDQTDFDEWENSLAINFTAQLRLVRELLHSRRRNSQSLPMVLFFAGGGTNGATVRYSAYTVSKIALIKMCELLDAEIPDVRFTILGPGWVQTKIHEATLSAGQRAGDNLRRTQDRLNKRDFVPMEKVLDCCDWLVGQPREVVGGRNFSVTGDEWGSEVLAKRLMEDPNLYKLRRAGNDSAVVKVR